MVYYQNYLQYTSKWTELLLKDNGWSFTNWIKMRELLDSINSRRGYTFRTEGVADYILFEDEKDAVVFALIRNDDNRV